MRFGLFTCPYQHISIEQAFVDAVNFGYDYIELWGGRPHGYAPDLLDGEIDEILRLSKAYKMPIEVYTPEHNAYPFNYMLGSERQRKDAIAYLKLALDCSRALGCENMLISVGHSGFMEENARRARLIHTLGELAEYAERIGHTIVLETLTPYESDGCTKLAELINVLNTVSSPALMGMCDVVVPFVQGENPADYARMLGSRMRHLHLIDSDGVSDNHLIPGDGIMNLRQVMAEFKAAGYDGRATIELVTHYMDNPSGAAEAAIKKTKELII